MRRWLIDATLMDVSFGSNKEGRCGGYVGCEATDGSRREERGKKGKDSEDSEDVALSTLPLYISCWEK